MHNFQENSGSYSSFFQEIADFAAKKGYYAKVLSLNNENKMLSVNKGNSEVLKFPNNGLKILLLGMNLDYLFLAFHIKKYFSSISLNEGDVILANGRAGLGLSWLYGYKGKYFIRMGQPAMTFLRNMEIANNKVSIFTRISRKIHFFIQSYLEKQSLSYAKGVITPSIETKNEIFNQYKIKIPYFVPQSGIKKIFFKVKKKPKKIGKSNKIIKMLFVNSGTEEIRKGIYYFKEALPKIFSLYPNLILLHVGDKINWIKGLDKKFHNKIICFGKVDYKKMPFYYKQADFLISASLNEGMPNTILEAMASGLPVLSSDIQGINEYLTNGKEGYIFKRGNQEDLLKGINFMVSADLNKMGRKARKKVEKLNYVHYLNELFIFFNEGKEKKLI